MEILSSLYRLNLYFRKNIQAKIVRPIQVFANNIAFTLTFTYFVYINYLLSPAFLCFSAFSNIMMKLILIIIQILQLSEHLKSYPEFKKSYKKST